MEDQRGSFTGILVLLTVLAFVAYLVLLITDSKDAENNGLPKLSNVKLKE